MIFRIKTSYNLLFLPLSLPLDALMSNESTSTLVIYSRSVDDASLSVLRMKAPNVTTYTCMDFFGKLNQHTNNLIKSTLLYQFMIFFF